jgi:hypothetical protein
MARFLLVLLMLGFTFSAICQEESAIPFLVYKAKSGQKVDIKLENWELVTESNKQQYLLNKFVFRDGSMVRVFGLVIFQEDHSAANGKKFHYIISEAILDCSEKTLTSRLNLYIDKDYNLVNTYQYSAGEVVTNTNRENTIASNIHKVLCGISI